MNRNANRLATNAAAATELSTMLANWYADHSSIRRLWALEELDTLVIFVALEPTSDGDDTLPIWFANEQAWTNDLKLLTHRELRLELVVGDVFERPDANTDAATIAAINWRDAWIYPLST